MPAALVPAARAGRRRLPTRTSGKIDRDALPWPLVERGHRPSRPASTGTAGQLQDIWAEILGAAVGGPEDDFFDLGGGSLAAAQLVSRLRATYPEVTVADVYDHPRIGDLAVALDELATPAAYVDRTVHPVSRGSQTVQVLLTLPLRTITGLRWLTWVALGTTAAAQWFDVGWLPTAPWAGGGRRRGSCWCPRPAACCSPPRGAARPRRRGPGHVPARGRRAPAGVVRRPARRGARRRQPRRRDVDPALRAAARGAPRSSRRPPLDPAGHRPPRARRRLLGRARGRPLGPLARRRPAARRGDRDRPRRAHRRAQHARPGRGDRGRRRDRARLGGVRRGARRASCGRARLRAAQGRPRPVGRAAPQPSGVGAGIHRRRGRHRRAARSRRARSARRRGAAPGRRRLGAGGGPARACSGCRSRPSSGSSC